MRPAAVLERHAALAIRVLLVGALVAGFVVAFHQLQPIVLPLLFALLFTALLSPAVGWLEAHGARRWFAAASVLVVFIALLIGAVIYVTAPVVAQAGDAASQVNAGIDELPGLAGSIGLDEEQVQEFIETSGERLQENVGSFGGTLSSGALAVAGTTVSVAFGVFLSLVLLVYLVFDGRGFWQGAVRLVDAHRRPEIEAAGLRAWHALQIFVRSQIAVALIDAIGIAIGLIVLGVPLVLPLAVLVFVLSFVPYIGATLSGLIVALVALSTVGPGAMLAILGVAALVQFLESNFVYPLLVGRNLRLHPITVLLAVGTGSALLGVLGAFFATPLLATAAAAGGLLPDGTDGEQESPAVRAADAAGGSREADEAPLDAPLSVPEPEPEPSDPAGAAR